MQATISEFSTNRHFGNKWDAPTRHPDLSFPDGNIAVLTANIYFLVHAGLLCRHSEEMRAAIKAIDTPTGDRLFDDCPVLHCTDSPEDMAYFLAALYDGVTGLQYSANEFPRAAGILRLSIKYSVPHLHAAVLGGFTRSWPSTLEGWEARERAGTDAAAGLNAPRTHFPHPILLINLGRELDIPQLLPAAFYDLCRYLPSLAATGYVTPEGSVTHYLSREDLLRTLQGREHLARFFSTFVVASLEGRSQSAHCTHQETANARRQRCTVAFEAVTFELIRDVNGVVCNRNSDVLHAIAESLMMQTREDRPGQVNASVLRTCEHCRMEFAQVVQEARSEMWTMLPGWFGVDVEGWAA